MGVCKNIGDKPRVVVLDESSSALDVESETRVHCLLQAMAYVSVGHRPTLLAHHDTNLVLWDEAYISSRADICERSARATKHTCFRRISTGSLWSRRGYPSMMAKVQGAVATKSILFYWSAQL